MALFSAFQNIKKGKYIIWFHNLSSKMKQMQLLEDNDTNFFNIRHQSISKK